MPNEIVRGRRWEPDQATFDRLLALLHEDREQAGAEYELLRDKLKSFFSVRHCLHVDDLADKTLNLLMRKLAEGEQIDHPGKFAFGIARFVCLEASRDESREILVDDEFPVIPVFFEDSSDADLRKRCLAQCFSSLPAEDQQLLVSYYCTEGQANKAARKSLFERLGISSQALRLRVLRLREKLIPCLENCLRHGPKKTKQSAVSNHTTNEGRSTSQ